MYQTYEHDDGINQVTYYYTWVAFGMTCSALTSEVFKFNLHLPCCIMCITHAQSRFLRLLIFLSFEFFIIINQSDRWCEYHYQ